MTTSGSGVETLYYYVGRTQERLDEVLTDVVRANLAAAERICASDEAAPEKRASLAHVAEGSQAWVTQMRAVNRRYEAAVEGIISQGIADGSPAPAPAEVKVAPHRRRVARHA